MISRPAADDLKPLQLGVALYPHVGVQFAPSMTCGDTDDATVHTISMLTLQ